MAIVKWAVSNWDCAPERKEYDKETAHFYVYRSGSQKVARRDAKISSYYSYFDTEAEALQFIADRNAARKRATEVDRIKSVAVELFQALESLVLFTDPKPSNAAALNNAYRVIAKAKGAD